MGLLVDTTVFVALDRQELPLSDLNRVVQQDPMNLASITASELLVGVARSPQGRRRERREAYIASILATIPVLPFDLAVARVHAQPWAELEAAGTRIGDHDTIIAATAVTHGITALTHNVRHFSRVPGLSIRYFVL